MGFVLYRSSAGSGKTYTLVKEYLKIVLQNPQAFKSILAVTFTNKAAGEMKERVVRALRNLSQGKDPELAEILRQEMAGKDPLPFRIEERSAQILTHILHNYSDFAIMTIDSFIHRVIKAFALEIDLPLNFSIVLNYERLESYVIEKLLNLVGRDEFVTDTIMEFVFARIDEEKSWNIEGDIRRFEKEILSEKNTDWVRGISSLDNIDFVHMIEQFTALRSGFVEKLNELGKNALTLIGEAGLTIDDFAYKEKGAAGFLKKCAGLREGDLKKITMGSRFQEGHWLGKSAPAELATAVENLLAGGLSDLHEQIVSHYEQNRAQALTAKFSADNIYLAAVVNRIKRLIDEFKEKNGVIPISEFNVKVYEIIKKSPVPFIYSLIGEKFDHYLIDEFQDTSRLQWENLFPLIENALAYDYFNMAVGDGKQSIYRWRGGDVEIMETDITSRIHPDQLSIKPLEKNYRSCRGIVEFNNRFFAEIGRTEPAAGQDVENKKENSLLQGIYGDPAQVPNRKAGGFVSLEFIERSATAPDDVKKRSSSQEKHHQTTTFSSNSSLEGDGDGTPPPADTEEIVFAQLNGIIADCQDRGYDLGDIAVLVRENKEGQAVAENLVKNRIPVVSPDSLLLAKVPLIRFFIDILIYLNNPEDKIAKAAVTYFFSLHKKNDPLDATTIGKHIRAKTQEKLAPELGEFFRRKDYLIRMPVYEVIEEVIRIFKPGKSFGFDTAGYMQAFLNIVSDYTKDNNIDVISFLEWWEFNKNDFAMVVPETKSAVKIMTIHKAKGLEFPVVIVPYANWGHDMDKQLWLTPEPPLPGIPPDLALPVNTPKLLEETYFAKAYKEEKEKVRIDNINLLYVAFTRAGDNLYIIAQPKRKNDNYELLKELAVPLMGKETAPGTAYTLGEPAHKEKKAEKEVKQPEIEYQKNDAFISNRWYGKISIRRKTPEFWGFDDYREERINWGILVHHVLAQIRSSEDVPRILEKIFISGDIEEKEKKLLQTKVNEIFAIETVQEWFKPGLRVFSEASMITDRGILRPDRVIIYDDKAVIIDFKTGEKNKGHANQLNKYRQALRAMGYQKIEAYLFYLENKEIQPVPDSLDD